MNLVTVQGLPLLQFPQLEKFEGLTHAFTTRRGGTSKGPFATLNLGLNTGDISDRVFSNRRRVLSALGWEPESLITPTQIHGNTVVHIGREGIGKKAGDTKPGLAGVDGLITREGEIVLMIKVADCFPVFLYDPVKRAIGLLHAGWRGTAGGIITSGIRTMMKFCSCDPENIKAGIGPGINKCCYTVGSDVRKAFKNRNESKSIWRTDEDKRLYLDLKKAIFIELIGCGLRKDNIALASQCTSCDGTFFFSHRRDNGKTGRMAAFIGLKG